MVAGQDTFLKKKKIISGSWPGGVWSCYPGHSVSKRGGKILQEIPGRGIERIPDWEVSSKIEKKSRVAALEESGAATRDLWCLKQRTKDSRRCLGGVSGGFQRRKCPPKEKNHLG